MTARANIAEGGTANAAVTTSNSGGTSGDPWDGVNVPTGTTIKFVTAAAYKGSRGYRITPGTGSTAPSLRWTLTGWPVVRVRFYVRFAALPSSQVDIYHVGDPGHAQNLARIAVTSDGLFRVLDAAESVIFTGSTTLAVNTWYRCEMIVIAGTKPTNGTIRFAYAAGDAAVTETFALTSANTGVGGALGRLYLGKLNGTWNANVDYDDIAADDKSTTTFLGASAASGTPVVIDPTPPPAPIPVAAPSPDTYNAAIRSSLAVWFTVDASYAGAAVEGASDLRPTGGSITDTTKPGVRRTLNLDLSGGEDLYNLLTPIGTTLIVTAHLRYTNKTVVNIPMGVFDVDTESMSVANGTISLTAPDKWVRLQRARFIGPGVATPGILVREQLAIMVRDAIDLDEEVNITATSEEVMPPRIVYEKDRDKFTIDLAASIGAWVYFDRNGVATVADIPTTTADSQYWLIDASDDGVLIDMDRQQTRTSTYNVVVVASSATEGELFPVQFVWDDDPLSPTYAGPIVPFASGTPFGIVPYYYDTPILDNQVAARKAGLTILARTTGLASQVTLTAVPNPMIDAFDVIDAVTPPEAWGAPPRTERHVVDTVTHPLTLDGVQRIDGRSSRTDEFVGGT